MNVASLLNELSQELIRRPYILQKEIIEQTPSLIKIRLHISPDLFIQIYRNDQFDTTNLALVHNSRRIYGRDQLGGNWHRHSDRQPEIHDKSTAGRKPVSFNEFLDEVEAVLARRGLP